MNRSFSKLVMMWSKSSLFLCLSLFICNCSYFHENNITNKFEFFEDKAHTIDISKIESVPRWNQVRENTINFYYTKSVIWLRAKVSDPSFKPESILSFEWRVLDHITLYYPNSENSYTEFKSGDSFPKSDWAVPEALSPSFRIPSRSNEKYFYIRLQSSSLISFPSYNFV